MCHSEVLLGARQRVQLLIPVPSRRRLEQSCAANLVGCLRHLREEDEANHKTRPPTRRRSTFTCVEKAVPVIWSVTQRACHLHVRREDVTDATGEIMDTGPPPRAWRKPGDVRHPRLRRRTTSTCVEKTPTGVLMRCGTTEHLHVRGEDSTASRTDAIAPGLPSLAWRRLRWGPVPGQIWRTTFTCVEKTLRELRFYSDGCSFRDTNAIDR